MKNTSEFKVAQFQDNYVEGFFQDGTSMAWIDDTITYYSLKGNRIKLSMADIHHSEDVSAKLIKLIQTQNRFNDQYIEIPKNVSPLNVEIKLKKYKIKEFHWSQSMVMKTQQGYEVVSDDNNAKLTLSHDLYKVSVQYLQMTSFKEISKQGLYLGVKNQRKFLLEKYSFNYNEFPTVSCTNQIQNEYHLIGKSFTIFNLPQRWYPPIHKIWGYLLSNELIPHPFCYIDLDDPQNHLLASISSTQMPPFKRFTDFTANKEEQKHLKSNIYPIFGKPNHHFKLSWMYIKNDQSQIIGYASNQNNILIEKQGFWMIQGPKVVYNSKNKDKIQYEVNISAFPITVRLQNQQDRQIKPYIMALNNYLEHRMLVGQKQKSKPSKREIDCEEDIVKEQVIQGVGVFKAFKNYMVKANFYDRIIVIMRESQIRVIDSFGKSWVVGNDPLLNSKYQWHINIIFDYYQKIFDTHSYQQRMRLNEILDQRKKVSNVFLQVSKRIQKNY